ncbi:MAG: HAMP domain-containing histidine kinase [Lachnospiraceae bacterium]|nr:HAMP domain-containing histidine kinase [Lachnospiraceae bacterium]
MINQDLKKMTILQFALTFVFTVSAIFLFDKKVALCLLLQGCLLSGIFFYFTKKRYRDIERINERLVRILGGEVDLEVWDNEEGELSILRSNVGKTCSILISQRERLKKEKQFLADFIADVSHQLKTPMTSMMVMNDLLEGEEDPEKQREFIQTQSEQLSKMNWLIQTLLTMSKLDTDSILMKEEKVELSQLIKEVTDPFMVLMDLKNITLVDETKDMQVKCDKNWSVEAIRNIVKNCIEHTDEGGSLAITSEDTNIYSAIKVRDTGSGIDPEDLQHIFERFYRGKTTGKESVGIGLALSKSIMDKQHGRILVTSEPGKGSTFEVRFYKTII